MAKNISLYTASPASRWIWTEEVKPNSFVAATREISLDVIPESATFAIFADTKYKLYINGRFVNAGPAPFRKPVIFVDQYDVTPFLVKGNNTIAILAHFVGSTTKYNVVERPGIFAELVLNADTTAPRIFGTDETWRVAPLACWAANTPQRNWAIEHVEDVDLGHPDFALLSRFAHEDYHLTGQGDLEGGNPLPPLFPCDQPSATPNTFDRPDLELRMRMVPLLRWDQEDVRLPQKIYRGNTEIHNWQDTAVRLDHEHVWLELEEAVYEMTRAGHVRFERREGEPGFLFLYDFGRVCAGEPAVEIICDSACTVDVCLAEDLTAAGRPNIWRTGGLYYARYHLQPGLNQVRFYHFNGHRFLYLSMKDAIGNVEITRVTTHHCRADIDFADQFSSEDRSAESLYRICRRALMLNTQAYTYDCNTREQGAYWGDGIWIVDSVGHATGDFSHMRHLCYAATEEVNVRGPFIDGSLYGLGAPLYDYCLVPPECLWRYYRYTGEVKTVEDNIDAIRTIVTAFRKLKADNGLLALSNIPDVGNDFRKGLLFLDHPGNSWHPMTTVGIDRRDYNAGFNLYYLQAVQALAGLEGVLGHDTATLVSEIAELKQAVLRNCFIPEKGLVADAMSPEVSSPQFSQITNALAITTGLLEGDAAKYALSAVMDIPRHPWISQGTPYTYFFLAEAAAYCRLADEAVRTFTRDFGDMVKRGATTTWEAWRAENHDSRNHAWSAPLPHLIRRAALGLEPVKFGYAKLALCPDFSAFDCFSATCMIPQGAVRVAWKRATPTTFTLSVSVPPGVTAVLRLGSRTIEFSGSWQGETC